jgi:hypothetical protein
MIELNVFVEGQTDAVWVNILLHRAFPRTDLRITLHPSGGKSAVLKRFAHAEKDTSAMRLADQVINVALVDADTPSLPDARREISDRYQLRDISDQIFFAVPELEAWLFADIQAAKKQLADRVVPALDRVQFSDEIPKPKRLATNAYGAREKTLQAGQQIIESMNLERAQSRSPSLREFLAGIAKLLGEDRYQTIPDAERLIGRRLIGQLVTETNPSSRVLYKTMSGDRLTAERLADEISQGTPIARQYAADLLRVARELLAREAALDKNGESDGENNT